MDYSKKRPRRESVPSAKIQPVSPKSAKFENLAETGDTVAETGKPVWKPMLVCMADIEPRSINWLWPNRIAAGRITLLVGMPGAGKSFLTCDMASRISTATPWPDGSACERGSVVFITAEDDPHDTIRPRLDAHRTDVSRVHLLSGVKRSENGRTDELMFTLADIDILRQSLESISDCKLVVIDPIGSFLGGKTDAHRDNEVRGILAPVAKLAEEYGPAILMVAHRRKSMATVADDMALGSRAFTGIARSVWHLSRDSEDHKRRLLLPGKSNLAAEQYGLAFTIAGDPAAVHWERDPVKMTADDALALENKQQGKSTAKGEAVEWLRHQLESGPKTSDELRQAAKQDSIAWRTVERAKKNLGIISGPNGFGGKWVWQLPLKPDSASLRQESPESANFSNLADSGDTGALLADSGQEADSIGTACTRCGGTDFRDTPVRDGKAIRRDCTGCGRTESFPVWSGEATA